MSTVPGRRTTCAMALCALAAMLASASLHAEYAVTLANAALELRFDVARGAHGHVLLTGIRDRARGIEWLAAPSPLFEFSIAGQVWHGDDLPVLDFTANDDNMVVSGVLSLGGSGHPFQVAVRLPQGEPVARVAGTLRNGSEDWFGPFMLGDHGARPVPVFAPDAHLASVRVDARSEEAFVVGFDGIVYGSREEDDGPWSTPSALYSTSDPSLRNLFDAGAPLAAVRRNDRQIDVFGIGRQGDIKTVFRRAGNAYGAPLALTSTGFFASGSPLAALTVHEETDPAVNTVEVYAVQDSTGQLYVIREDDDGVWSSPRVVTPAEPRLGTHVHVAALQRNTRQRDVFLVDDSGDLLTTFNLNDRGWSSYVNLSGRQHGLLPPSAGIAAVNGKGDDLHVFAVGNDRRLYWTHEEQDGPWTPLTPITEPLDVIPGAGIAAVHRTGREILVAVPLRNGAIAVLAKVHDAPGWTGPDELQAARRIDASANLSLTLRRAGQLDLFYVSKNDRRLWTSGAGAGDLVLRTVWPKLRFDGNAELRGTLGMVSQEAGAVAPLRVSDAPLEPSCEAEMCRTLGMPYAADGLARLIGLPEAMNSLEVASVTRDGATLYVLDASGNLEAGRAPLQLTLSSAELAGFWERELHGAQQVNLPTFEIGVAPSGTWRVAVDRYVGRHRAEWHFPDTPSWLADAGAIYTFGAGPAGGIYLELGQERDAQDQLLPWYRDHADAPFTPEPSTIQGGWLGHYARWYGGTFEALLPQMLSEARGLGTDVVYLYDYWDSTGTCKTTFPEGILRLPYFCKGDYRIRDDLGARDDPHDPNPGLTALRRGIANVHAPGPNLEPGGRVILYLEPFLIGAGADVYNQYVDLWGARLDDGVGDLFRPFGGDPSLAMSQAMRYWQDRVVDIATRLIRETGADGIFLDSGGWRMNMRLETWQEVAGHSALEHAQGFLELVDRVRREIRKINPDAVVLAETTAGPIARHLDGGVSADFHRASPAFTGAETVGGRMIASPIRYGVPEVHFFTNGQTLAQMNQVFAAGQSLALAGNWTWDEETHTGIPPDQKNFMRASAAYIQRLVHARRSYADALVHGRQVDQATTEALAEGARNIVAYGYAGATSSAITIVNLDDSAHLVGLNASDVLHPGDRFCDVVSGDEFTASSLPLIVSMPPAPAYCEHAGASRPVCGLRVLVSPSAGDGCPSSSDPR